MSGSKRRTNKRDIKARLYVGGILILFALGVFIYMLLTITSGITSRFIICGVVVVVFLFVGSYILGPVLNQIQKKRQAAIAKGK